MNKAWIVVIAVIVLIAGLSYLGTQSSQTSSQQEIASPTATPMKIFEVEGKPFEFSIKEMRVKKGDTVRVVFRNAEGFHDFVIDEFNVRTKQIQAGENDTVEFAADSSGTFEYYCSVGNHRQMGMRGNLIVE